MDVWPIAVGGLLATITLTILTAAGQGLGLTRIDIPFIIGTAFTANRDRAHVTGVAMHLFNGWIAAILYALVFIRIRPSWWFGAILGTLQGLLVILVVLPILPAFHPRMVSDFRGPEPTRLLEPPGFLATNYGRLTPIVTVCAHAAYGAVLGVCFAVR